MASNMLRDLCPVCAESLAACASQLVLNYERAAWLPVTGTHRKTD